MMLKLFVFLFFGLSLVFAAPTLDATSATNTSATLNFTAITSGYCEATACSSFIRPPVTTVLNCTEPNCACTDTVASELASCLQCGYDNTPGMTLTEVQSYLSAFTSACSTNGTAVETETLVSSNGAARLAVSFAIHLLFWVMPAFVLSRSWA